MPPIKQQVFLIILLLFSITSEISAEQVTVGWVEKVTLGHHGFNIHAKIDTGADNSSINAENVSLYTKQGQQWVKFTVQNMDGRTMDIDKPVIKKIKIKKKEGGSQKRMVIEIDICLSGIRKKTYVNLVDRSHFKYQVLIGRSFLSPDFLVDSSKKFSIEPKCQ